MENQTENNQPSMFSKAWTGLNKRVNFEQMGADIMNGGKAVVEAAKSIVPEKEDTPIKEVDPSNMQSLVNYRAELQQELAKVDEAMRKLLDNPPKQDAPAEIGLEQ